MRCTANQETDRAGASSPQPARTILVVDDDAAVRESLALALALEGYGVRTAANGVDALLVLRTEERIDAIVLDLEMPLMSGPEFRDAQLSDPALSQIPVVVLSTSPRAVAATLRLPKPIDVEALLRALRELTRR